MPDHTVHTAALIVTLIQAHAEASRDIQARRFQCRHVFTDGHRCGSPCLKGQEFCYYHHTARRTRPETLPRDPYLMPPRENSFMLSAPADLADRSGIQQAITEVLNKLANNEIDPRRAGLLLYGLQIASHNLPRPRPVDPIDSADAVDFVDELTLHPVHGPIAPEAVVPEDDEEPSFLGRLISSLSTPEPAQNPEKADPQGS